MEENIPKTGKNSDTQIESFNFAVDPPHGLELKLDTSGAIRHLKKTDIKPVKRWIVSLAEFDGRMGRRPEAYCRFLRDREEQQIDTLLR